ncbi:hypothetical protein HKX48_006968 [Thoreauomyces humboldtii]|nr:hypothetical protein HKX48_006968 [Thoreauomyces humboldtii]
MTQAQRQPPAAAEAATRARRDSRVTAAEADHALPAPEASSTLDPGAPFNPSTSASTLNGESSAQQQQLQSAAPPSVTAPGLYHPSTTPTQQRRRPSRMETFQGEAVNRAVNNQSPEGEDYDDVHKGFIFKNPADLIIVPTTFVFIFVNPNSGPRQGASLLDLDIYGFRMRSRPDVQVTMCNLMEPEDRNKGLRYFQAMQTTDRIDIQRLHVWSAGGDGTFMWVLEELMALNVNMHDPRLSFCTIPFGTGNDLSQVMGWGRSIVGDPAGDHMHRLDKIITQRLAGEKARLDIWEIEVETREGGYVQKAAKSSSPSSKKQTHLLRKMSNYSSLGVQGFVGVGFEPRRHHSRFMNILEYARQSASLVFHGIPRVHTYTESLEWKGKQIVTNEKLAHLHRPKSNRDDRNEKKQKKSRVHRERRAIEIVVQNIPGLWGRHVDMWGTAKMAPSVVSSPEGPTDIANWGSNKANDGKLEVFTISNEISYVKKQMGDWGRKNLSRIGQFPEELNLNLIEGTSTALMVDGEFYKLVNCKSVKWKHLIQITVIGPDAENSRMVRDSADYFKTETSVPAKDPVFVYPSPTSAGAETPEVAVAAEAELAGGRSSPSTSTVGNDGNSVSPSVTDRPASVIVAA